jgi:hypothetical protein
MASRFWVTGGTGNWNSTTNWSATSGGASGASVPSTADTATFNASSGSGTATLDISPTVQTLTMTGFTGTLAFGTNTISLNSTGTIFTGATTMTVTGTPLIICTNNSATSRTIAPGAVTEANSISFRITAGTGGLTTSTGSYRDLDFTDGTNPTGFAGALGGAAPTIYGNFKASTGMIQNASTSAITFSATSGTKTINTAGVTFDRPFTFDGVGGTFQLASALTSGTARTCTLTNGTLDLNSYTLTIGIFTGTGSGVRSLITNSVPIVITGNSAIVVNFGTTINMTVDVAPTFNLTYSGATGTRTISVGATNNLPVAPNITVTAGSDIVTTGGTTTVRNLTFNSGFTGTFGNGTRNIYGNLTLVSGMATPSSGSLVTTFNGVGSQTITTAGLTLGFPITFNGVGGTWTCTDALNIDTNTLTMTNGTLKLKAGATSTVGSLATTGTNMKYLQSSTAGTQATISAASGTINVSYLTIQDINATGGATFNAFLTNQNINGGNNTGWDFYLQVGRYIYTRRKNKRILL